MSNDLQFEVNRTFLSRVSGNNNKKKRRGEGGESPRKDVKRLLLVQS